MNLQVKGLHGGYGNVQVLRGVDFTVESGEVVTLLGRNGSGRSTTCKAILNSLPGQTGEVRLGGVDVSGLPSHAVARAGIGYVPEERLVFTDLTVQENLLIGCKPPRNADMPTWTLDELYAIFPRLQERRDVKAGFLSGGEQQMLAIFRTLMGNPAAILIDEPTEGLAPTIVEVVGQTILEMKRRGLAVLLVEQKLSLAFRVSDRVLVMGHGQIVFTGSVADFRADDRIRRHWLEVS